jgi:hypothetical protein
MVEISWKKTKYKKNSKGMLNHSLSIVFEEYFLQTHPSQNICRTIFCQFCLKNISYKPIHPRIYIEPLIVNCVWRIFPTDPSTP